MNRLRAVHRLALAHPVLTLGIWAVVCLAALPGIGRLELRIDGRSLVPRDDPAVVRDLRIRQRFGLADPVAVVVTTRSAGGIYRPEPLAVVAELTRALAQLPGVAPSDLVSLATERSFRPLPGSLDRRRLLDPLPTTPDELTELRSDLERLRFDRGFLVSRDASATAIYLQLPDIADRRGLLTRIDRLSRQVISRASPEGGQGVDLVGAPVAEALLGDHLLADLGVPDPFLELPQDLRESGRGGPGLVPLVLLVIAGVFAVAFRRAVAVALPLGKVAAVLVLVLGAMGWLGVPIHLTTAILPVVLVVLAIADEIHLLRRARELAVERPDDSSRALATRTLDSLAGPVVRTSLTTAVGFLSFTVSPIVPIRWFGLWTAVGIAVAALWALTATPVLLALAGRRRWAPRPGPGGPERILEQGLGRLAGKSLGRPRWAVTVGLVVVVAAGLGAARLTVHDSWSEGFDPASPTARSTARFEDGFAGAHLLLVEVAAQVIANQGFAEVSDTSGEMGGEVPDTSETEVPDTSVGIADRSVRLSPAPPELAAAEHLAGARVALEASPRADGSRRTWSGWLASARLEYGALVLELPPLAGSPLLALRPIPGERVEWSLTRPPFETPEVLWKVAELERFLAERPEVGAVVGPARTLETVFFMRGSGDEAERRLPRMPFEAEIGWDTFERAVGPERLERVVAPETMDAGLVTAFLRHADSDRVARLTEALDDYARRELEPAGLTIATGGDAVVSQALIAATVRTQLVSLALALLALGVAAWWIGGRSGGVAGAAAVGAPPAFAVLLVFGAMGWAGVPLGVATSMFAGMTLGLGLDGAIHLHARFREIASAGTRRSEAAIAAWSSVGPAILVDTLAVGLGFAVLWTSAVPANARLGALLVLALASTFVATLLFAPLLLAFSRRT